MFALTAVAGVTTATYLYQRTDVAGEHGAPSLTPEPPHSGRDPGIVSSSTADGSLRSKGNDVDVAAPASPTTAETRPENTRPVQSPSQVPGQASLAPSAPSPDRRPSFLPAADAAPEAWRAQIARSRAEKNVVALQAIAEATPGRDPKERAWLLADAAAALGSVGGEEARRSFDDLLASPRREVKLAAMNAAAIAFPEERAALLTAWTSDPDPVIQVKAKALREALR